MRGLIAFGFHLIGETVFWNLLKGQVGDEINVLMAACAWNLRKWLIATAIFYCYKSICCVIFKGWLIRSALTAGFNTKILYPMKAGFNKLIAHISFIVINQFVVWFLGVD
jgi:hypothetical protein